jgi:hypothetical protein
MWRPLFNPKSNKEDLSQFFVLIGKSFIKDIEFSNKLVYMYWETASIFLWNDHHKTIEVFLVCLQLLSVQTFSQLRHLTVYHFTSNCCGLCELWRIVYSLDPYTASSSFVFRKEERNSRFVDILPLNGLQSQVCKYWVLSTQVNPAVRPKFLFFS